MISIYDNTFAAPLLVSKVFVRLRGWPFVLPKERTGMQATKCEFDHSLLHSRVSGSSLNNPRLLPVVERNAA